MLKSKNHQLSIHPRQGLRLVHGGKHLLDPVRLSSGLLQLLLICLPRTRLWRVRVFQYKFAKKKGMGMCFCWLDWQRIGRMSGEKWWIERTKLGILHDSTRKIQAEIRIIIIRFQLIKHNHREKCRIHHDPKTTPHGRTPPAACFSSSLEGRDCETSTALPW